MWRDDKLDPNGMATINTVVICAEDKVSTKDIFTLVLVHAIAFHGKGFMPSVRARGRMCNGEIIYGTDEATHVRALAKGEEMLTKEAEQFARECAEFEERYHKRP